MQDYIEEVPRTLPPEPFLNDDGAMDTLPTFGGLLDFDSSLLFGPGPAELSLSTAYAVNPLPPSNLLDDRSTVSSNLEMQMQMQMQDITFTGPKLPVQGGQFRGNEELPLTEMDLTQASMSMFGSNIDWHVNSTTVPATASYHPDQNLPQPPIVSLMENSLFMSTVPPAPLFSALPPTFRAPLFDYQSQDWMWATPAQPALKGAVSLEMAQQSSLLSFQLTSATKNYSASTQAYSSAMSVSAGAAQNLAAADTYPMLFVNDDTPFTFQSPVPFPQVSLGSSASAPYAADSGRQALLDTLQYAPGKHPAGTAATVPEPFVSPPYIPWPNQILDLNLLSQASVPVCAAPFAPGSTPDIAPPIAAFSSTINNLSAGEYSMQSGVSFYKKRPLSATVSGEQEGKQETTIPTQQPLPNSTGVSQTQARQGPPDTATPQERRQRRCLAKKKKIKSQRAKTARTTAIAPEGQGQDQGQPAAASPQKAEGQAPIVVPDSPGDEQAHTPISITTSTGIRLKGDTFIGEPVTVTSRFGQMSFSCYVPGPPKYKCAHNADPSGNSVVQQAPPRAPNMAGKGSIDASKRPMLPLKETRLRTRVGVQNQAQMAGPSVLSVPSTCIPSMPSALPLSIPSTKAPLPPFCSAPNSASLAFNSSAGVSSTTQGIAGRTRGASRAATQRAASMLSSSFKSSHSQ